MSRKITDKTMAVADPGEYARAVIAEEKRTIEVRAVAEFPAWLEEHHVIIRPVPIPLGEDSGLFTIQLQFIAKVQ